MTTDRSKVRRCAVYTRKSSEEGLDQDFNSLDAQREACMAYIASQKHEGWKAVRPRYDDGGWSGGTIKRPALTELLADIRGGKVDTVVVYKVDRLTRSLADFAKIVEIFDNNNVAFVSVTQQFNTTTSMGRLTLNMLLSFAQFEREVTGERIRDKIAASKKKGMWMGGFVPLGYEADGRTLKVNPQEAETIKKVFGLYLELGNVRLVKVRADELGLKTKVRKTARGDLRGGKPLSRGYIYKLLSNPLYIGRVPHKGTSYPGLHPPIVERETWDAVQAMLKAHGRGGNRQARKTSPSPLVGKVFDESERPLTPSHAVKSGRRYRYYVSRHLIDKTDGTRGKSSDSWRVPAGELERLITNAVQAFLDDANRLAIALRDSHVPPSHVPGIVSAVAGWRSVPLEHVRKVNLRSGTVTITLELGSIIGGADIVVEFTEPIQIKRRGVEMRLVLTSARDTGRASQADPVLLKTLARAQGWYDDLRTGRAKSLTAIAEREGVTQRYVAQLLPLAFLAPKIVEAIVSGNHPVDLTARRLVKHVVLPLDWWAQNREFGFG